jgi:hypothetical protein
LLALDIDGKTAWHVAVKNCPREVFGEMWGWAKENVRTEELPILLLAADIGGGTVFRAAAERTGRKLFEKLGDWVKEALTPEEVK